jgi:hypothetical protein
VAALNTGRLPVRLAPLVGRQRELREVVGALARSRLMSLTGPGGTGKSRLALAAADAPGACPPVFPPCSANPPEAPASLGSGPAVGARRAAGPGQP